MSRSGIKLFVDMDNTLCDFNSGFIKTYKKLYGENLDIDPYSYDLLETWEGTPEEKDDVYTSIFCHKGFWLGLEIYPQAAEIMKKLNQEYDLYICSKPTNKNKMICTSEKLLWIERYLPFIHVTDQVIFIANKSLLGDSEENRILIDDYQKHLKDWDGTRIKYWQPYNKDFGMVDYTVLNWQEIENILF